MTANVIRKDCYEFVKSQMEFSDHEHLESQQAERYSVKCLSLPVPVKFYQEDLISLI